ncbi:hypothetical protein ACP70R_030366 [Stipagrostis hirtigluma subsp. patula]
MSNSKSKRRRGEPEQEVEEDEGNPGRKNGAVTSITVELEAEVLDCPVCFEPLRPPIFQCAVGHLICSSCCGKLPKPKKCHHCSCTSDYNRCYGIEKIVRSIQVPCSNTKYGCAVKTSYHKKENHEATCPHMPCFCPEAGCSFARSTRMLQDHFTAEHHWPSTKVKYGLFLTFKVQDGVRVLSDDEGRLFLLNMASEPFGRVTCSLMSPSQSSGVLSPSTATKTTRFMRSQHSKCQARRFLMGYHRTASCSLCQGCICRRTAKSLSW